VRRVTFDTNVFISALNFGGNQGIRMVKVLDFLREGPERGR